MIRIFLIFLLCIPLVASAIEVKLKKNGKDIDVIISNIELPSEKLKKDLKSGLSVSFQATLSVSRKKHLLRKSILNFKAYYDLWDEVFYLQTLGDDKHIQKFSKESEVLMTLQTYSFSRSISEEELKKGEAFVRFALALDPISKEKKLKIRKWLAQNQIGSPSNLNAASDLSTPIQSAHAIKSRGLFGKILDSEIENEVESGEWIYLSPELKISKDNINEK